MVKREKETKLSVIFWFIPLCHTILGWSSPYTPHVIDTVSPSVVKISVSPQIFSGRWFSVSIAGAERVVCDWFRDEEVVCDWL